MKIIYFSILSMAFWIGILPQAKAVTMPISINSHNVDSVFKNEGVSKTKAFLFKKTDDKDALSVSKVAKILGFTFVGLILSVLIVPFQARLLLTIIALGVGLLAIILALVGLSSAKEESTKKKARKSLWTVLVIVAGIILISILVALIVLLTVGFA